jgi:RNA polymerase sigma-70 factor (ECF subfamily)
MLAHYTVTAIEPARAAMLSDEEVVDRVRDGETALFEILMRRYNQRLYRVARSILGNDHEAEDVMQEAYVRAYAHLDQFAGRAKFSTWLTKIAVHEAFARLRRSGRLESMESETFSHGDHMSTFQSQTPDPERQAFDHELSAALENAVESLPEIYRSVFMLREIEEISTEETAESLGLSEEAVKARLHRARALLRKKLYVRMGAATAAAFHFYAPRCDRVVAGVFERIRF